MYINFNLLEKYFKKNGMVININIDIEEEDSILKFVQGQNHEGSRVEFLSFLELNEILEINNITSEGGFLIKEREALKNGLKNKTGEYQRHLKKMESLIYDTLAKYIIKMFHVGIENKIFPELKPLNKHRSLYFHE
jgi:hypothetical protein